MDKVIDLIEWKEKTQYNSIPKKALRRLIRKYGNSSLLAKKIKRSKQYISRLVNKDCRKGCRLINKRPANRIEKMCKVSGIADELSRIYK